MSSVFLVITRRWVWRVNVHLSIIPVIRTANTEQMNINIRWLHHETSKKAKNWPFTTELTTPRRVWSMEFNVNAVRRSVLEFFDSISGKIPTFKKSIIIAWPVISRRRSKNSKKIVRDLLSRSLFCQQEKEKRICFSFSGEEEKWKEIRRSVSLLFHTSRRSNHMAICSFVRSLSVWSKINPSG